MIVYVKVSPREEPLRYEEVMAPEALTLPETTLDYVM